MTVAGKDIFCACGHAQSFFHKRGTGPCRCGCLAFRPMGRSKGLEVLETIEPGGNGKVPVFRVRCPKCRAEYVRRSFLRQLVATVSCRACRDRERAEKRMPDAARSKAPADLPTLERLEHGKRGRYVAGCRCDLCAEANRVYARARQKLGRMGQGNPLVSASRARRHIQKLSELGVGRGQVGDASGVAITTISDVGRGRKTQIRRETEARILSVSEGARADSALVSAARTWKILNGLLADGFTRQELARRLGSKAKVPALQVRSDRVLASTAAAVERLYREIHGTPLSRRGRKPKGLEERQAAE